MQLLQKVMAEAEMKKRLSKSRKTVGGILVLVVMLIGVLAVAWDEEAPTYGEQAQDLSIPVLPIKNNEIDYASVALGEKEGGKTEEAEGEVGKESGTQENVSVWVTASDVNLRAQPNRNSEVLQRLNRNEELILQQERDGWGEVIYKETKGYVSMDYLTREKPTVNGRIVVIDPGHQEKGDSAKEPNGPDSSVMKARVTGGTKGCSTKVMEYELNLIISLQLREELEKRGYTVYLTRTTHDVNISNMERAQYATEVDADIAVRIHANGAENSSARGALALVPSSENPFVSSLSEESRKLGQCILDSYCQATGMGNQGIMLSDTMTGINWSTVPVTILEMGYMTNASDDENMMNADYQRKMVKGVAEGIDEYFGIYE